MGAMLSFLLLISLLPASALAENHNEFGIEHYVALGHRLITGFNPRTLDPDGTATRAQMAVILKAYDQM